MAYKCRIDFRTNLYELCFLYLIALKVGKYTPFRDRKSYVKNIGVVFGQKTQLRLDVSSKKETSEAAKFLFNNFDIEDFRVEEPSIEEIIKMIYTS